MILVGVAGLTLFTVAILEKRGVELNQSMVSFGLETAKYGMIGYILYKAWVVFI